MGTPPELIPALFGLFVYYWTAGDLEIASEMAEQILALAKSQAEPDRIFLLIANLALGGSNTHLGQFGRAVTHLVEGISLYNPELDRNLALSYVQDPRMAYGIWKSWCLWFLGYPDQAFEEFKATIAWAEELRHPFTLAFGLSATYLVPRMCGEINIAQ